MLRQRNSYLSYALIRLLSTSSQNCATHYDVLGITPKATQSDIKTAYYKLSKVYHPDKSDDEASAKKFRAIAEAYEVLGNVQLKKMYDKGLLVGRENTSRMEYTPDPEPMDPTLKFYKSRVNRHVAPTIDGKTPVYNFDAWQQQHYGDLLKKTQYERDFLRKKREKQTQESIADRQEGVIYCIIALTSLIIFLVSQIETDYDSGMTNRDSQPKPSD